MENNKEYQKWLEVVEKDGRRLRFVPEDLINKELCEVAVKDFPYALQYVPENMRTFEICDIALSQGYLAAELLEAFVPDEFQEELAEKYDIELPDKDKGR